MNSSVFRDNTMAEPATADDVRALWWRLSGLITGLDLIIDVPGRDGMSARGAMTTILKEDADRFSKLVEAAAEGLPIPEGCEP